MPPNWRSSPEASATGKRIAAVTVVVGTNLATLYYALGRRQEAIPLFETTRVVQERDGEVLLLENMRFYAEEEGKPKLPKDVAEDVKKAAKAEK